jgi:hypothetical protein
MRETAADVMVSSGMFNSGYECIVIDYSFSIRGHWKYLKIGSTFKPLKIKVPGLNIILIRLIRY